MANSSPALILLFFHTARMVSIVHTTIVKVWAYKYYPDKSLPNSHTFQMPYLRRNGDKAEKEFLNLLSQEFLIMATEQSMELGEKKKSINIPSEDWKDLDCRGLKTAMLSSIHIHPHSVFNLCAGQLLALTRDKDRTEPFFPDTVSQRNVKKKLVAMTFAVLHFYDLTIGPGSFHFQLQAQRGGLYAILNSC